MTVLPVGLPEPRAARDGLDAPFWEGLAAGRLMLQVCAGCGAYRFPAEWICPRCRSFELSWDEVSARGAIYTWTRVWHPTHPALKDACPYVAVVVALDADPSLRMLGNLVDAPDGDVVIGSAVEGVFEDRGEDHATLLQWRLL